ncbi:unnamed protein product [Discosporangium mesarthrocarpum]
MERSGHPRLQHEVDPSGYLVVENSREQLGGLKWAMKDMLFLAKSLNRTLVEPTVKNSMILEFDADSMCGLGVYWDLEFPCSRGYRIIDLHSFDQLLAKGLITQKDSLHIEDNSFKREGAIQSNLYRPKEVKDQFKNFGADDYRVVVIDGLWGTKIEREESSLVRLNPFHERSVSKLLKRQGWAPDRFISVQWRTERAEGDLAECYHRYVRPALEEARQIFKGKVPVYINTDIDVGNSESYDHSRFQTVEGREKLVQEIYNDYGKDSQIMKDALARIEDSGIRAIVGGLISASASTMLASSLSRSTPVGDGPWETTLKGEESITRWQCDKDSSKYIGLVIDWRLKMKKRPEKSLIRLFPLSKGRYENLVADRGN